MESAAEFLATGKKFQLGFLETEKPHPLTSNLSHLAVNDLPKAFEILAQIDSDALEKLKSKVSDILNLRACVRKAWNNGGRVFICGCGATGRLALTLEFLFLNEFPISQYGEKVIAFMAGGDVALVHSLEGFEDFPEFGKRYLEQLGFGVKDLLISATEGGETPYVIGATEAACEISNQNPFFLYCNPDDILESNVERSRRVIQNPGINKINLTVGPMALAGSTRMQASTVLQLAIGYALLTDFNEQEIKDDLTLMQEYVRENAASMVMPFTQLEAQEYLFERYILYQVQDYPMVVFTDTTERAPTFSLTPFSHRKAERLLKMKPSRSYVSIPQAQNSQEAWEILLNRKPRPLNWLDVDERTGTAYLEAFDFSRGAFQFRSWLTHNTEHSTFEIFRNQKGPSMYWRLQKQEQSLLLPKTTHGLFESTILKMFLNMHSTLVMGRLGRYKRNLMTWVYPTNGKLIDRASRYVKILLQEDGIEVSYESIVHKIFELKKILSGNESIVLAAYRSLGGKNDTVNR